MNYKNFPQFLIFSILGCLTMPGVLFGPAMVGILVDHANFSDDSASKYATSQLVVVASIASLSKSLKQSSSRN
jgi:membrane protein DedA with SNARE-associated domain